LGFDAPMADVSVEDMFWMVDGVKAAIQGVPNFNKDQELPLGLKIAKAGLVRIKIDALENIDNDVQMYIKDNFTGERHKINNQPFEFNLEPGVYLDRFSLVFSPDTTLGDEDEILNKGIQVFMKNSASEIHIRKTIEKEFLNIQLYNILGQNMHTWDKNINESTVILPVKVATGVYMVTVNTSTGRMSKKIIVE